MFHYFRGNVADTTYTSGVEYDISNIPHLNQTKKSNYRSYYTEQWMIDKVQDVYASDILFGDYKF